MLTLHHHVLRTVIEILINLNKLSGTNHMPKRTKSSIKQNNLLLSLYTCEDLSNWFKILTALRAARNPPLCDLSGETWSSLVKTNVNAWMRFSNLVL